MYCHSLSVSVAVVLTLVFAIGLAETAPTNWIYYLSSLLSRIHNYCLLLLIWSPFMVSEPSPYDLCMHTTRAGNVTRTLLFHT
jgi:hypothetical protein